MEELEESKESPIQKSINILVTVLLILAVLLCVYVAVQVLSDGYVNIGGFMMFRVVTGSMEPNIPVGALLVTQQVDIESVQVNDVVCFRTQEAAIWGKIVTHRVVGIFEAIDGSLLLETKGDANLAMDGYYVSKDNLVGKVIWHTGDGSMLAGIFSFFTNEVGFLGCIVFPCLMLAGLILKDCVVNIRRELQAAMEELEKPVQTEAPDWEQDPFYGMTAEEYEALYREVYQQIYQEMYERIRAELIEELMRSGEVPETAE